MTTHEWEGDPRWSGGQSYDGEFATERLALDTFDIVYTDWGDATARPFVLVHGINVQGHTWDPIARELAREARVIVPDLRGHGQSGWARDGYRVDQFADDVGAVMDAVGSTHAVVVGHSLGARVAIALAGRRPDLVDRVVLSDTGPEVLRAGAESAARTAAEKAARRGFNSREEAVEYYRELYPDWAPIFHELHARYQLRENWASKFVERADPDLFWINGSAGRRDDEVLWSYAHAIEASVLMLHGAHSAYNDATLIARFATTFPSFTAVELPCGHYIPREMPASFCDEVRAFTAA